MDAQILAIDNRAQAIICRAKAENRSFTPEEDRELGSLLAEFDAVQMAGDQSLGRRAEPDGAISRVPVASQYENRQPMPRSVTGRNKTAASIFGAAERGGSNGFNSLGEFVRSVGLGLHHPGLQTVKADFAEGAGETGGYYVPPQYGFNLIDAILERSIVLSRAEVFPMQSNQLVVPSFDYSDHGSIGGFAFSWLAELETAVDQTGTLKSMTLNAHKLGIYTTASIELVSDGGPNFTAKLMSALADSAAFGIDHTLLNSGDGTAKPLSVLNSPSLIAVPKEGGQAANTLTFNNVLAIFSRIDPACLVRGQFFAHPSTLPQLYRMAIVDNAAAVIGAALPEAFKQTAPGQFSLLGRPLEITEKLPPLGTAGDLLFADLSRYVVGMRKQIGIERSISAGWQNYSEKFRLIMRLDGQAKDATAVTPISGADTLSWAAVVAAR